MGKIKIPGAPWSTWLRNMEGLCNFRRRVLVGTSRVPPILTELGYYQIFPKMEIRTFREVRKTSKRLIDGNKKHNSESIADCGVHEVHAQIQGSYEERQEEGLPKRSKTCPVEKNITIYGNRNWRTSGLSSGSSCFYGISSKIAKIY